MRALALDILQRSPVKEILAVSAYTPSVVESIPIASVIVEALGSGLNRKERIEGQQGNMADLGKQFLARKQAMGS